MKVASAASEVVPIVVYLPYLIFMLRRMAAANTSALFKKVGVYGTLGFCITDPLALYLSQSVWWPITATVYTEAYKGIKREVPKDS